MDNEQTQPLMTGVEFASEVLIPGGSNIVKGKFLTGGIHTVLGLAARAMFGFPGLLIVSANSFAMASTGQNLVARLKEEIRKPEPAPEPVLVKPTK